MVKRLTKAVPWHTLKKDCSVLDEVPCNIFKQTAINVVYAKDSKILVPIYWQTNWLLALKKLFAYKKETCLTFSQD